MESLLTMDLQHIARLNGNFKVTKNAYDYFKQWYDAYTPNLASKMAGYYERKHDHLLKLAMILSICEDDELVIKESHLKAGLLLLEQVEKLMPQAFAYVGATNEARIAQHIIELIVSKGGLATHKTCFSGVREQIKNKREFESVIETLIEAGIIFAAMRDKIVYYVLTDEYAHQLGAKKRKEKKKDGTS